MAFGSTALAITGDVTLEAWVKPMSAPPLVYEEPIVGKYSRTSGKRGYLLAYADLAGTYSLELALSVDGDTISTLAVPHTLALTTWQHVAVSYTASTGTAQFYVDGQGIGTATGGPAQINNTTVTVTLGQFNDTNDTIAYWDGLLDEVRIWSVPRTGAQIDALRLADAAGNEIGLAGLWHLNGTYGDATGGGATLTPMNGALFSTDVPY